MIISFLLDGILSNYFNTTFTFLNIIINCCYKDKNYMLKEGLIIGILYDITYTNTLILNGFLFFFIILFFYNFNRNNKYTFLIIILCFIFYKVIPILLLIFFRYSIVNFKISFISLLINLIYFIFLFLIKHKKIFSS
jgi:cell shape-determining protein MreD